MVIETKNCFNFFYSENDGNFIAPSITIQKYTHFFDKKKCKLK